MRISKTSIAVAVAAVATLLAPATADAAPGDTVATPVRDALQALSVADEDRTGYERTKFKHWVDADKDGCNTRMEVLKDEAFVGPEQGTKCALTGGSWYSPYDDTYFDDAGKLDIDHLVPLAEAWDSGASTWTAKERQDYANDLGDDRDLIAVSAKSNRSKADQDPATWLPAAVGYRCQYVTDWIADKTRWGLSIDATEKTALAAELDGCPNAPVEITRAR